MNLPKYFRLCKLPAILVLFTILFLYSCTGSKSTPKPNADFPGETADSLVAYIERTRCFGVCPHYSMRIYRSGYVMYEGYENVKNIGRYYLYLDAVQLRSIGEKAEEIGYFELLDEYKNPHLTDFPTIYSEVRFKGKRKKITRYDASPPQNLVEMENYIDKVIPEDAKWIKHADQNFKD